MNQKRTNRRINQYKEDIKVTQINEQNRQGSRWRRALQVLNVAKNALSLRFHCCPKLSQLGTGGPTSTFVQQS
jgi:hypothetical protein